MTTPLRKFIQENVQYKIIDKSISKKRIENTDKRYKYIIKIGDESFDYYDSIRNYNKEQYGLGAYKHIVGYASFSGDNIQKKQREWMIKNEYLQEDVEIVESCLYSLVLDYSTKSVDDLIDEIGYEYKEAKEIRKQISANNDKLEKIFTQEQIEELQELYQGY